MEDRFVLKFSQIKINAHEKTSASLLEYSTKMKNWIKVFSYYSGFQQHDKKCLKYEKSATPTWLSSVDITVSEIDSPEKRIDIRSYQPTLWLSTAVDITVLAESSLYFIFSPGYLAIVMSTDMSGRCRTLPFFLTFFITLPFQVFLLY